MTNRAQRAAAKIANQRFRDQLDAAKKANQRNRSQLKGRKIGNDLRKLQEALGSILGIKKAKEIIKEIIKFPKKARKKKPQQKISQESFFVTFSMDRTGERKISQVLVSGRPPTNYSTDNSKISSNQGPHIVAFGLMKEAVRQGLVDTTLIPEKEQTSRSGSSTFPDTIKTVERLYKISDKEENEEAFVVGSVTKQTPSGSVTVSFKTVDAQIKSLIQRRDTTVELRNLLELEEDEEDIKKQVRKKVSELRQDLNVVTEDIIRLWNKRVGTTYSEKGGTGALQFGKSFYNLCGAGIASRENAAIRQIEIEGILGALDDVAINDIVNTTTDTAASELVKKGLLASKTDIAKSIARLIDIKSVEEIKSFEILQAQYDETEVEDLANKYFDTIKDNDSMIDKDNTVKTLLKTEAKEAYTELLKNAVGEACRLTRIVLKEDSSSPSSSRVDETLVLKALFTASKEDLKKTIENLEKTITERKRKNQNTDKQQKQLERTRGRLKIAEELIAIENLDFENIDSIFNDEESS